MIIEDYCSYEVAKLLKEKGFEGDINAYYHIWDNGTKVCSVQEYSHSEAPHLYIPAPTLQIAMKWLREEHNLYYEIKLLLGEKAEKYGDLQLGIYQLNSSGAYVWKDWIYADTYIELYENYIKYCLENICNHTPNNPKITIGTKIRSKVNPDVILSIISDDCHEDEFECSNGSVLSLRQIKKYYDIII